MMNFRYINIDVPEMGFIYVTTVDPILMWLGIWIVFNIWYLWAIVLYTTLYPLQTTYAYAQGWNFWIKGNKDIFSISGTTLVAQMVKNPSALQETWVQFLGQEDPLEKEMASCLENSMDRGAWQATVHGVTKSRT